MLRRRRRATSLSCCVGMAGLALAWAPDRPRLALGVLGGGALAGLAFWALAGVVERGGAAGGNWRNPASFPRVGASEVFHKACYTRLVAYGMMIRLHLDPVGMLVGVTAVVVAAAVEAARPR